MTNSFDVALIMIVVVVVLFILRIQSRKELANSIAETFCSREGLQLLDGTVAFRGVHFTRPGFSLAYRFRFDYSTDRADRFSGHLTLVGEGMQNLYVDPAHLREAIPPRNNTLVN